MDPTLREYIRTYENIKEEIIHFKSQRNKLQLQISKLYEEYKKLYSELKENAEMRYLHFAESDVGQLEEALQEAVASKKAAIEMWQLALEQLAKQEELLEGKKSIVVTERSELEKQFAEIKRNYITGLDVLSRELANSKAEISRLRLELDEKNSELEKCKSDMNSFCEELDQSKKSISELSHTNDQLKERILTFQSSLSESDKTLDEYKEKMSNLMCKNSELLASVSKLEDQNKKLKSEILVYEKDAKDSLQTAQEAVLHMQEIMCKEEQYQNEIKMLKASIEGEKETVSIRYKAEIKEMREKCNKKVQNLISEIENLHKQIGEKQNLFERANRQKQALESKLELLSSKNSSDIHFSGPNFEDMCKRLTMAERSRDELQSKVSSLETTLQELKSATEQEIQFHLGKQRTLSEKFNTLSREFNQVSSDRLKLADEVMKLRKRSCDLEKELTATKTKYTTNMSALEGESRLKLQAVQEQLCLTEEHYKNVCSELQKLLEAEFKISGKWKSEVKFLISESEKELTKLLHENVQLKNSNIELINILHQNSLQVPNEILINLV